jgi:hypothetical protein
MVCFSDAVAQLTKWPKSEKLYIFDDFIIAVIPLAVRRPMPQSRKVVNYGESQEVDQNADGYDIIELIRCDVQSVTPPSAPDPKTASDAPESPILPQLA